MNARRWTVSGYSILLVVIGLVWLGVVAADLPDPVATHFSGLTADGFTARSSFVAILAVLSAVAVIGAVLVHMVPVGGILFAGLAATLLPAIVFMMVALVATTDTAGRANPAALIGGIVVLLSSFVPFWLVLPRGAFTRRTGSPADESAPAPALSEGQRRSWYAVVATPIWLVAVLLLPALLPMLVDVLDDGRIGTTAVAISIALVVVVLVVVAPITVSADRRGLRVSAGILRIPLRRIPLADIDEVWTEQIKPVEWGGWGYRVLPGRAAVVLRGGPGLVVRTAGGRLFAVTVDGADDAVLALRSNATRA